MRDKVADPDYLLQQKVERRMNKLYPDKYFPMYSMVSFSDIEYRTALKKGQEQDEIIKSEIIKFKINSASSQEEIDTMIHQFLGIKVK
jgi:kynurenine 3-monooxygenase